MLLNVVEYGGGDKGNRLKGGDFCADVAGGHLEGMAGAEVGEQFFRPGRREVEVVAAGGATGAGEGHDAHEGQQLQRLVPGVQLGEGVGADDENKLLAGVKGLEGAEGVDGVGFSGAVEFNGECPEAGFVRDGELEHGEAVGIGSEVVDGFVGRDGAGNEPDSVQLKETKGLAGDGEMSFVHGVERAAEQPDGTGH